MSLKILSLALVAIFGLAVSAPAQDDRRQHQSPPPQRRQAPPIRQPRSMPQRSMPQRQPRQQAPQAQPRQQPRQQFPRSVPRQQPPRSQPMREPRPSPAASGRIRSRCVGPRRHKFVARRRFGQRPSHVNESFVSARRLSLIDTRHNSTNSGAPTGRSSAGGGYGPTGMP